MTENNDDVQLRLAIQRGLLWNVPSSVRFICVKLEADHLAMVACFSSEPTEDEKENLLDAGFEAAGDFPGNITVGLKCIVDDRPMGMLIPEIKKANFGRTVYARHEEGYG